MNAVTTISKESSPVFGGPVLGLEMLLGSRRNKQYLMRWLYGGWLILQFSFLYLGYRAELLSTSTCTNCGSWLSDSDERAGRCRHCGFPWSPDTKATDRFAGRMMSLLINQQFILLLLATPVLAAGAITDEKESGTLQFLFSAGLTSAEIVTGKLLARLLMVANLILVGAPFLFFFGIFAGLHAGLVLVVLLQAAVAAFALAAASVLASVWARHTRDAVLGLYALGGLGLLILWGLRTVRDQLFLSGPPTGAWSLVGYVDQFLRHLDPLYPLAADAGDVRGRMLLHLAAWGTIGLVFLILAVARLRGAYLRQLEGVGKRRLRFLGAVRPAIGKEPIRWKERFVVGLAPLPWLRYVPRWLAMILILIISTGAGIGVLALSTTPRSPWLEQVVIELFDGNTGPLLRFLETLDRNAVAESFFWITLIVVLLASAVVGIRCSGAITGEREKSTWEALLLTPLTTPQLVRAKLWGVVGATYPYLAMYAIPTVLISMLGGPVPFVVVVIGLGVTWLAMFYVGATGLWCSARSKGSWRSLLGMFGYAYLGGFLGFCMLFPVWMILWAIISLMLFLVDLHLFGGVNFQSGPPFSAGTFRLAVTLIMVGMFFLFSWLAIRSAEKRVANFERTRHWRHEPVRPRRRRRWEDVEWAG